MLGKRTGEFLINLEAILGGIRSIFAVNLKWSMYIACTSMATFLVDLQAKRNPLQSILEVTCYQGERSNIGGMPVEERQGLGQFEEGGHEERRQQ